MIHPGSALRKRRPSWLMAAELVETSRLWARTCAAIEPDWIEAAAPHLAKRTYAEPRWSVKRAAAIINEKVQIYGLPVHSGRPVLLSRIDKPAARELFIRHALVQEEWLSEHSFLRHNRDVLARAEEAAARSRSSRPSFWDEDLFAFYDARLPASVVSARHFESWWNKQRQSRPAMLDLDPGQLIACGAPEGDDYPDSWRQGQLDLALSYNYSPGLEQDGVTVHIPIELVAQVRPWGFDWQVPGLRQELIAAWIKSLPKPLRSELLPAKDTASQAILALGPMSDWTRDDGSVGPLTGALSRVFNSLRGVHLPSEAWNAAAVPAYLKMAFQVESVGGKVLARGHNLRSVVAEATQGVGQTIRGIAAASPVPNVSTGDADDDGDGTVRKGLRGAVRKGGRGAVRQERRDESLRLLAELALPAGRLTSRLAAAEALPLVTSHYTSVEALVLDAQATVIDATLARYGTPTNDADYARLRQALRQELEDATHQVLLTASELLKRANTLANSVRQIEAAALAGSIADIKAHLATLLADGFLSRAGVGRLNDLRRYLKAEEYRLERLNPEREGPSLRLLAELALEYQQAAASLGAAAPSSVILAKVPWMLEELRVSLFAQALGTAYPVSAKRIRKAISEVDREQW